MPDRNRRVLLRERPTGRIGPNTFELSEEAVPEIKDGEAMVRGNLLIQRATCMVVSCCRVSGRWLSVVCCRNGIMNVAAWAEGNGVARVIAYRWFHAGLLPVPARKVG
jgi:hypothetical protein